jgi:hypothetical protein
MRTRVVLGVSCSLLFFVACFVLDALPEDRLCCGFRGFLQSLQANAEISQSSLRPHQHAFQLVIR